MSTVEAFLLGVMVALTPGMVVTALLLCAMPDAEQAPSTKQAPQPTPPTLT